MRDVFEALESGVEWHEADQRIVATRGTTVIELWIGRQSATVDGRVVVLPVAPRLVDGSTYVPLRFPAEAFGGSVSWDAANRTANIDIPPPGTPPVAVQPPTTQPPTTQPPATELPPVQPPVTPQPATLEGVVIQVLPAAAGVVVQATDSGGLQVVQVDQNTILTRGLEEAPLQAVALADVRVGDYARATLAQGNLASRIAFTYGQIEGKILAIAGNTLVLDDGTSFHLSQTVRVLDSAGKALPLTGIAPHTLGRLFFEPRSRMVYELRVAAAAPQPQPEPQAEPEILTVGLLNTANFFRRGDVLKLQLRGTPGGQATASIEQLVDDLPLIEVQPGVYQRDYTIDAREDLRGLAVAGDLTVGGVPAQTVVTPTRLVIANTPPTITGVSPPDRGLVPNDSPLIGMAYEVGGDAPLDPRGARMMVNGRDVSYALRVYDGEMVYAAQNLHAGEVRVQASVRDLAGNEAAAEWTFPHRPGRG